jgi:hypothetical protein
LRLTLTENRSRSVVAEIAAGLGQTRQEVVALLGETSRRLRKLKRLGSEPILVDGDHVKVVGVAGLVRVEPGLELEVAPKFLGHEQEGWREDFFRIAGLTRSGWILPHEKIDAGKGQNNDLASLVGRVMVTLFKEEERRPIRLYRTQRWDAFEVDGDLDEESIFLPSEEGFAQEKIALKQGNHYNEIIAEAARLLILDVEDQDVRRQLQRMYSHLSPQRRPPSIAAVPSRLPSRHRRWQQLYDVSRSVVAGFRMDFKRDEASAPGFVVKTWPAWEDLLYLALRTGLSGGEVSAQQGHRFGTRNGKDFNVTPDGTVSSQGVEFLWDAKYKVDWKQGHPRISSTDVYEANAFLEAAEVDRIALLYPRLAGEPGLDCGMANLFETVELASGFIHGLSVEARGISARGGFQTFSTNLTAALADSAIPSAPRASTISS